jgi:hypothetical protein
MHVATALRIVSVVVAAKALLIGVVYWRRAEILGRPVHIGAGSWACLIAVVCRRRLKTDPVSTGGF